MLTADCFLGLRSLLLIVWQSVAYCLEVWDIAVIFVVGKDEGCLRRQYPEICCFCHTFCFMKGIRFYQCLALCLLGGAFAPVQGQTSGEMVDYFVQQIEGGQQVAPVQQSDKVKISRLAQRRSEVWNAWQEANRLLDEPVLPALSVQKPVVADSILLPDTLEPSAVMNYYWVQKGDAASDGGWPVFIYLHGSGPRDREWSTGLKLAQQFDDAPSRYFVPRIPNEGAYYRWWQRSKQWTWNWLLRRLMLDDSVNARRLYVFGISEGGYGSQRLASFYADYWAAAGPMAGGEPLKNAPAENCRNIGFSLLTGADDTGFYRNQLSRLVSDAFDSLQTVFTDGFKHRIELILGRGHHIDYRPTTPWLKTFSRNPWPRHFLWEDFEMDGWHRNGFYNLAVEKRPCDSLRTRYRMDIADNRIELSVDNVHYQTVERDSVWGIELRFAKTYTPATGGALTLFLNEHLVDLSKPVTVVVNGKEVFRGKVTCRVGSMMRSLCLFYDRERIFPAEVEVRY